MIALPQPYHAGSEPRARHCDRFLGLPMGHEFAIIMAWHFHSGGHPIKLLADVIEQIKDQIKSLM